MIDHAKDGAVIDLRRVDKLWDKDAPRFFICHSAKNKVFAQAVKEGLGRNGIAAFVAHDDIEPTSDWRKDIELALDTMDVLVALLTENFPKSDWAGQEVGYALGQSKPIIPVTIDIDPYGMMGKYQALSGKNKTGFVVGRSIAVFFWGRDWPEKRLEELRKSSFISALDRAESFDSANKLAEIFHQLDSLSPSQADAFMKAFNGNGQVSGAHGFDSDVADTLSKLSGAEYVLDEISAARKWDRRILKLPRKVVAPPVVEDDLPF